MTAFTEASLLAALQASGANPNVTIVAFHPVSTTFVDVYVENLKATKNKTGGWVQIDATLDDTHARDAVLAAMN